MLIYSVLRLLLFGAALGMVAGIWVLVAGEAPILWCLVLALAISGITSYFWLSRPRDALARRVEDRVGRASARLEEMRAKEDVD